MTFDKLISILVGTVLTSAVAFIVSGALHAIWIMWTR